MDVFNRKDLRMQSFGQYRAALSTVDKRSLLEWRGLPLPRPQALRPDTLQDFKDRGGGHPGPHMSELGRGIAPKIPRNGTTFEMNQVLSHTSGFSRRDVEHTGSPEASLPGQHSIGVRTTGVGQISRDQRKVTRGGMDLAYEEMKPAVRAGYYPGTLLVAEKESTLESTKPSSAVGVTDTTVQMMTVPNDIIRYPGPPLDPRILCTFRGHPKGYPHLKKLFRCPLCLYTTDRRNNLKRHVLTMHRDCGRDLECCDIRFRSKAGLREHVLLFHRAGYTCRQCGRNFCRKALLRRHTLASHPDVGHEESTRTKSGHLAGRQSTDIGTRTIGTDTGAKIQHQVTAHADVSEELMINNETSLPQQSCTDLSSHGKTKTGKVIDKHYHWKGILFYLSERQKYSYANGGNGEKNVANTIHSDKYAQQPHLDSPGGVVSRIEEGSAPLASQKLSCSRMCPDPYKCGYCHHVFSRQTLLTQHLDSCVPDQGRILNKRPLKYSLKINSALTGQ